MNDRNAGALFLVLRCTYLLSRLMLAEDGMDSPELWAALRSRHPAILNGVAGGRDIDWDRIGDFEFLGAS